MNNDIGFDRWYTTPRKHTSGAGTVPDRFTAGPWIDTDPVDTAQAFIGYDVYGYERDGEGQTSPVIGSRGFTSDLDAAYYGAQIPEYWSYLSSGLSGIESYPAGPGAVGWHNGSLAYFHIDLEEVLAYLQVSQLALAPPMPTGAVAVEFETDALTLSHVNVHAEFDVRQPAQNLGVWWGTFAYGDVVSRSFTAEPRPNVYREYRLLSGTSDIVPGDNSVDTTAAIVARQGYFKDQAWDKIAAKMASGSVLGALDIVAGGENVAFDTAAAMPAASGDGHRYLQIGTMLTNGNDTDGKNGIGDTAILSNADLWPQTNASPDTPNAIIRALFSPDYYGLPYGVPYEQFDVLKVGFHVLLPRHRFLSLA